MGMKGFPTKPKKSWFFSRQAFIASRILALGSATVYSSGYLLIHGHFVYKYKEIVQLYSSGVAKQLAPDMKEMAEQVRHEVKLEEEEKTAINFFLVYGHDVFHAGSTNLRGGGIVGLPDTFNYTTTTDVEKSKLKLLGNRAIEWDSRAGKELQESLILSRKAQKFAIAREIHHCTTNYVYVNSFSASVCLLGSYVFGNRLSFHYNLYRLPRAARIIVYGICGSIGLFTHFMIKDGFSQYWDSYTDKMAAETSPEYLLGGIEFYEKSLKKNVALRKLLGEYGGKVYTWHGNKKYFIRAPNLPLTTRLDKLKQMKAEKEFDESSVITSEHQFQPL